MLPPERLAQIVQPYATVSDRIRALDAAGVARADIARFLGKRYQHVRNVLEGDQQKGGYVLGHADLSGVQQGVEEGGAAFDGPMNDPRFIEARGGGAYRLVVRPDGSVVLPREVRDAFNTDRDKIVLGFLEGDEFKLISADTAMRQVQEMVRRYIPEGTMASESLIADRRREAEAEEADDD
ncbi:AbrB/MazE/SpoVT family DNA-binding domain-containing protein [Caulobacter sp. KR2-114]|uniref:AbrB/MazE/SpoVT family DNA-binding domain-containing protein n=1 Tax=Caulobacter sp. KR2-114 TaxID=3400912 RepID=UPI003BFE2F8E